MLVLTRKPGESLYLYMGDGDERVDVKVIGTKGNQVRLGIDAPRNVKILRDNAKKSTYQCST